MIRILQEVFPSGKSVRKKCKLSGNIIMLLCLSAPCLTASTQTADELLAQGREAFMDYRFGEAARLYGQAKAKAKRTDEFYADKHEQYQRQLDQARGYLERVERIEIIDSIAVPRNEFFKAYRLPASAGRLGGPEAVPRALRDSREPDYVFTNERGNYKLWAEPDSTGFARLTETSLLTDGSWSEPTALDDELGEGGDAAYPFMMADGTTLYYAANGDNTLGGYDIMVATRDAADGTFMQPSNLGFPYNSPYDDYLLAIDELNGVGWWATDRNQLDELITVYVFIPRDIRVNYDSDRDDIISLARIGDYGATMNDDSDYTALLQTIAEIDPEAREIEKEFLFPAKGKTYYRFDQLPDHASRTAMTVYQNALKELNTTESRLLDMRKEYHRTRSSATGENIRRAEKEIEKTRQRVAKLRSDVYKALK